METLRRASIYAGRDARVAAELLKRLTAGAQTPTAPAWGNALALLDAAFMRASLAAQPDDPSLEFAAARNVGDVDPD